MCSRIELLRESLQKTSILNRKILFYKKNSIKTIFLNVKMGIDSIKTKNLGPSKFRFQNFNKLMLGSVHEINKNKIFSALNWNNMYFFL
jgi:hypothetical protein